MCSSRASHSDAVIGVSRQNCGGPVKLLEKQDAYDLMRPGCSPKSNSELRLALQFGRKSVRTADYENGICHGFVAPAAEMSGKSGAVDVLAAFVERDQHGFFWDGAG